MKPTIKDWIDAIGLRVTDMFQSHPEIDQDTLELLVATVQIGLLSEPRLLKQWTEGNSIVEHDYFEDLDEQDDQPKEPRTSWRRNIRRKVAS